MFCQVCGSLQNDESEYCDRCNQKLLVVSGPGADEIQLEEQRPEDNFSFDEHLLERISVLEEVLKRTAETVRDILSTLQKQEKNLLINHTGLNALRRHAAGQGRDRDPGLEPGLGAARAGYQLLALEKRERFAACRDRIEALYRGKRARGVPAAPAPGASALPVASSWKRRSWRSRPPTRSTAPTTSSPTSSARPSSTRATPRRRCATSRASSTSSPTTTTVWSTAASSSTSGAISRRAEEFLERAVEVYPDAFLPHFCLGAIHARRRQPGAGRLLPRAGGARRIGAAGPLPAGQRATTSWARPLPAIRALRNATRLDPAFEEAHHLLGLAYLDRHWRRKALESFRQAQRLNPKKMRYRDLVRYLLGRSERAAAASRGRGRPSGSSAPRRACRRDRPRSRPCAATGRALRARAREPDRC